MLGLQTLKAAEPQMMSELRGMRAWWGEAEEGRLDCEMPWEPEMSGRRRPSISWRFHSKKLGAARLSLNQMGDGGTQAWA